MTAIKPLREPFLTAWHLLLAFCFFQAVHSIAAETNRPLPRVYRDRVQPHWIGERGMFWYKVDTGENRHEYILVNPEKGTRMPAFDHKLLASALRDKGVKDVEPERLALDKLEFPSDAGLATFRAGGKPWKFEIATGKLEEAPDAPPPALANAEDVPRASVHTGEETSLRFVNRTAGEVQLFWLDTEGERRGYGKLKAGETRDQHTFAGHVWLVIDADGKELGRYQAAEEPATAEIGATPPPRPAQYTRPGRRSRRSAPAATNTAWTVFLTNYNVALKSSTNSDALILTKDGIEADRYTDRFHWSPDGKKLVVMREKKGDDRKVFIIESSPKDQLQPKLQSYDYLKPGDRVTFSLPHLFNLETRSEIPIDNTLFPNPWSVDDVRWSPDSSRFTFVYNQRGHQVLRVIAVDAASGKATSVIDEKSDTFVCYSGKFFVDYMDDTGEILWMSERDGWNHLYLYDARADRVKNQITKGEWMVRQVERVDKEKRQIWFRAGGVRPGQDPYYVHYCRVNFDGSGFTVLTEGDGSHSARFSPDNRFFIDTWSRVDLAPVNELLRSEDGTLVCKLEETDTTELAKSEWRPPERFVAKGRDGQTDIYGIIHWPDRVTSGRKHPVVESIYAGPQDSFVPKTFHAAPAHRKFTERGFFVVQIDGMGTSNRSKKFHDVCWKNLADAGLPDRILWMQAAARLHPEMDLDRVGIYGTSAGGQSALGALLQHPDFYKVGVTDCGCHDNRVDKIWWNEQWMGWPIGPHYEEQSNVTLAHKLQGKLLLAVGELDKNVDPASTMQVVNALIKADKDFDLVVVPGAGHGVLGMPYMQRRMLDFFTRHLQPDAR